MSLIDSFQRVLVLCAHTDDEFGCAGTISRLVDAGADLRYVAMSRCEESVPEGLPQDILVDECRACTSMLGLSPEKVEVWDFPVRYFPRDRQAILERLVAFRRGYQPDLVLVPSSYDTHQDHAVVRAEGFRAFKHASMFGYELPQNTISFDNTAFVALSERTFRKKVEALSAYASQDFRPYSTESFMRGLATVRGVQAGVELAEAFELIRLVVD